ncbi:MAG: hypothetical protein AAF402_06440 [Pseudomonadota bacterium]
MNVHITRAVYINTFTSYTHFYKPNEFVAVNKKKSNRRRVLKGFGVSVPSVWIAPSISSVVLPVHAQTTGGLPGESVSEMTTTPGPTTQAPIPPVTVGSDSFAFTFDCSNQSLTAYYVELIFSDSPPTEFSTFQIINRGASDPGPPSDSNMVLYTSPSTGNLELRSNRGMLGDGFEASLRCTDNPQNPATVTSIIGGSGARLFRVETRNIENGLITISWTNISIVPPN